MCKLLTGHIATMHRCLLVSALLLLVPCPAATQTPRDEAIRLLLGGDYHRAAQALRPLAEDPSAPDSAAQFFLALLYDFGQGVPRTVGRACGLYRQVADGGGPFAQTAAELRRMLNDDSPTPEQFCSAGPYHGQPEALFALGPNHSVQYASNTIVVRYQGAERKIVTGNLPGVIQLPSQYTPLDITHPVRERRHFLQSFWWSPDNPTAPASWELIWGLSEVVGAEFVHVTFARNVVTAAGTKPPADANLGTLVRVHVGATGEPEWVVASGPNARSAVVPRREPR